MRKLNKIVAASAHRPGGKQLVGPIVADNPFLHWVPPELRSEYNRYVAQMAQGIRTDRHINGGHRLLSDPDIGQTKSALPLLYNRGRRFIAGEGFEPTTYQIFVSGSACPTIDKS